jgi:hypothetical protein
MPPAQAQYLLDSFPGSEIVLKTFANDNVHNTWILKQDDVCLLVDESSKYAHNQIKLGLGRSSHAYRDTGSVTSEYVTISYSYRGKNVGEINASKKEALEELGEASDDLYEAFVKTFGKDTIRSDNRES